MVSNERSKYSTKIDCEPAINPEAREEWRRSHKLKNDPRITPVGYLLRKSNLDELPQLWNILKGEMNLVGPRPIVEAEIKRYAEKYPDYISARPGLTGLWQVSGRSNTSYEFRVKLDSTYVKDWSSLLDAKLLIMTIPAVLFGKGSC